MLTMWQWWTRRSIKALAITSSPKTSPHSSKLLLLVSTVEASVRPGGAAVAAELRTHPAPDVWRDSAPVPGEVHRQGDAGVESAKHRRCGAVGSQADRDAGLCGRDPRGAAGSAAAGIS